MRKRERIWVLLGAVAGLVAVAMAAVVAHAPIAPARIEGVRSAVQVQAWHALALLFTGLWGPRGGIFTTLAGLAFALGTALFCGAVYGQAFLGWSSAVAPLGGVILMVGWGLLGLSALRK